MQWSMVLLNGWLNMGVIKYSQTSPASPPSEDSAKFLRGESAGPVCRGREVDFLFSAWIRKDCLCLIHSHTTWVMVLNGS